MNSAQRRKMRKWAQKVVFEALDGVDVDRELAEAATDKCESKMLPPMYRPV